MTDDVTYTLDDNAGGLFAINYEIVTSEIVGAIPSANVLMMTYIGGIGYFFGPILGAILITIMELMLANITHAWVLYYGLMFVAMILWAPGGLAGSVRVMLARGNSKSTLVLFAPGSVLSA